MGSPTLPVPRASVAGSRREALVAQQSAHLPRNCPQGLDRRPERGVVETSASGGLPAPRPRVNRPSDISWGGGQHRDAGGRSAPDVEYAGGDPDPARLRSKLPPAHAGVVSPSSGQEESVVPQLLGRSEGISSAAKA